MHWSSRVSPGSATIDGSMTASHRSLPPCPNPSSAHSMSACLAREIPMSSSSTTVWSATHWAYSLRRLSSVLATSLRSSLAFASSA